MIIRIAAFSVLTGLGFLAASAFSFLDRSGTTKVGPSLLQGMLDGFGMLWFHLATFLLAFIVVHAIVGAAAAWALGPIARKLSPDSPGKLTLLVLLVGIIGLLMASAAGFPHSMIGTGFHDFAESGPGIGFKWLSAIVFCAMTIAGAGLRLFGALAAFQNLRLWRIWEITALVGVVVAFGWAEDKNQASFPSVADKPHIILVGVDGWRLKTFQQKDLMRVVMPFVSRFANDASTFDEAATPLARTYPAWWTVFSGQFPPRHGVRFNLISDELISSPLRLPVQLGEQGYHRILAMDERRFANFRLEQGFDAIIGPASGAADFLIAGLHDTPLVNLLVNTPVGRYLFPFLHANRAAYHTYKPVSFDALVDEAIDDAPRQPLFFAAHFELPHWPFIWARKPTGQFLELAGDQELASYYEALQAADRQIEALFTNLRVAGILENAIVVLLSDHGEALPVDDREWTYAHNERTMTTPVGHGTHVLGLNEYRIPLMIKGYGAQSTEPGRIMGRASLADIYPTIADFLDLPLLGETDGVSLYSHIKGDARTIPERSLPVETGFNPDVLSTETIEPGALLAGGIAHYKVTSDGNLELKLDSMDTLMHRKDRAIIRGNAIFKPVGKAADNGQGKWLLADIKNRHLREIQYPRDRNFEIDSLRRDFCRFFGDDPPVAALSTCPPLAEPGNAAD